MTLTAPPAQRTAAAASASRGRRQRSLSWMALPALLLFVAFALVPLIGCFLLSFTTWDGLGKIHISGLVSWRAVLENPGLPHALWVTFLIMALSWGFQTPMSILIGVFLAGHQRYRGFLAIEATAAPAGFATADAALKFLRELTGIPADIYEPPESHMPRLMRAAQRRTHPDTGGDAATFQRVSLAEAKLREVGLL